MERNPTIVTIIRHGETEWNRNGKHQGQLDSPLSALGMKQTSAVARFLARGSIRYDVLYSSDLGRSVQSAALIAKKIGLRINLDGRLRERKLGIIEGLTMEEFKQMYYKEYEKFVSSDPDYIIPKGESIRQRSERAVSCLVELVAQHEHKGILVVTHGGILDSIFREVFGISLEDKRRFSLINSSINTFSVREGKWKLESWGNTSHLDKIDAEDDFI